MTQKRNLRSSIALIALAGVSMLSLAACQDDRTQAKVFESRAQCEEAAQKPDSWWSMEECKAAFAKAQERHAANAPRYDALEVCEEQHGQGMCQADTQRGDSSFLPLMMGYFMGSMNNQPSYLSSRPLYPAKSGGYRTADGTTSFTSLSGSRRLSSKSFQPAPSTLKAKPMSRADVAKRGGFGKVSTSRSSGIRTTSFRSTGRVSVS